MRWVARRQWRYLGLHVRVGGRVVARCPLLAEGPYRPWLGYRP